MITSIITFLVILSVLVIVHELGHFLVARKLGIWVEEFGFGLPPRVFGKKIGETIYSINLLPFGGFVRLHGENLEEEITNSKRAFLNRRKSVRIAVIVAGVVMNFILAIVCFATVYSFTGIPKETTNVKVVDVTQGSPAQIAGLIVGDVVKKVGKTEITNSDTFIDLVAKEKGKRVQIEYQRNGETKKVTLTPRENPPAGEGPVGITISTTEVYYPPIWQRPFVGIYYGFKDAVFWGKQVALGFVGIFQKLFVGQVPKDLSGPIGIYAITSQVAKVGFLALINFVGILSVNLAFINILPFPALDGGRLLFIVIEAVMGRKVLPKVEATIHTIGMIVLLTLLLAITIGDIQKVIVNGGISGFVQSMLK